MDIQDTITEWQREYQGHPGKFEGEGPEALYFYRAGLDGEGDFCDQAMHDCECDCGECPEHGHLSNCQIFEPTEDERKAFGLRPDSVIHLSESEQGFVYCSEV